MGYNPSKKSVEDVRSILAFMLENKDVDFKVPTVAPDKLAYGIRRAMKGIKAFPKSFPEFQILLDRFTMKEKDDHVLFARRISLVGGTPITVTPKGLATSRDLSIESVTTPLQVVGALIKHKADSFRFPDAAIDDESLTKIYKWTSTNGYHIVNPSSQDGVGLQITRSKPVNEWQPQST